MLTDDPDQQQNCSSSFAASLLQMSPLWGVLRGVAGRNFLLMNDLNSDHPGSNHFILDQAQKALDAFEREFMKVSDPCMSLHKV